MASIPIGPGSAPVTHPASIPPAPAVMAILGRFEPGQLASFIEVAIGLLDLGEPDPDLEEAGDDELTGDEQDAGWTEHHTRGRHKLASGMSEPFADHEDDEDDDPDHALDEGEPNFAAYSDGGAGCPIADPSGCEHDGREPDTDAELHPMLDDVPMLPVVTLAHNIFTDQRQPLGYSNLQSSFVCGSDGVLSADTGALHVRKPENGYDRGAPGVPV